ncbi:nicotinamidase-related amidase [Granulicella aggregans]|uniref:Nicotinamidase-related amidase n=1 Tax=Granulicella aggregans TaxID=474949 RepID=A0A7W7ZBG9_9BACT|nr:isochorismatase family cysteine hydrolase [Granulicella aggregans]MBB5056534.1 nicotinamidase-related amidase [Granulicella aggregans]
MKQEMIVGKVALIVIDIQKAPGPPGEASIPLMGPGDTMIANARELIAAAREADVPVVFIQEVHRPNLIDFGRELDGVEGVHCLEDYPLTAISDEIGFRPESDYWIKKRRYSAFFGTEFAILMKGLKAETLILIGGLTDVCVHYTFVDAHQSDFYTRVVEDCVIGSSFEAHNASLAAMEYLQTGARRSTDEILAAFAAMKPELVMA